MKSVIRPSRFFELSLDPRMLLFIRLHVSLRQGRRLQDDDKLFVLDEHPVLRHAFLGFRAEPGFPADPFRTDGHAE